MSWFSFRHTVRLFAPCVVVAAASGVRVASAQAAATVSDSLSSARTLRAHFVPTGPTIDGRLNEALWSQATEANGFTQRVPVGGAPASQRTVVKILYDRDALYVGVRNADSAPDSIAQQLGRRDADDIYSDWFFVGFDSYGDRRTGFVFGVSPRGVLRDAYLSNDNDDDDSWDAVWNVASHIDSLGWTAEFRIPLSQLRYDVRGEVGAVRPWGINFSRVIARSGEDSFWAPTPANAPGFVSRFGTLTGLDSLRPPSRTEFTPYVRTQMESQPLASRNRFTPSRQGSAAVGLDMRIKLPQSLTVSATVNPDFGQVEADPAVVNLSAFEIFFPERRAFFLENADALAYGSTRTDNDNDPPRFFYTRRIGRAPQRRPTGSDLEALGVASRTPILGALKLSGTTPSGWQIGMTNAVTPQERADVLRTGDRVGKEAVEPLTNYHVSRVRRLFNSGNSGLGTFVSHTARHLDDSLLTRTLPSRAQILGVDWEHAWHDRTWTVSGVQAFSDVRGAAEVIARLQRANYRSFQRPDADHLTFDSTRTRLRGAYSALSVAKTAGRRVLASATVEQTTPGLEVNDLGFQTRSDFRSLSTSVSYRNPVQSRLAREWFVSAVTTNSINFDGDHIEERYGLSGFATLNNFWRLEYFASVTPQTLNDRLLRGGPLALRPASQFHRIEVQSDDRQPLVTSVELTSFADRAGGWSRGVELELDWRPVPQARLRLTPGYSRELSKGQYITSTPDAAATQTFGRRYTFADVRQRELRVDTRVDWTFSPWLSFQLFLQPFVSSGAFADYKAFVAPRRFDFAVYGRDAGTVTTTASGLRVDPDGAGAAPAFTLSPQDFTVRALRGNAVFRWEFRPGSSVFLVWSQQRERELDDATLRVNNQFGQVFRDPGQHVFLVKFSRWIG